MAAVALALALSTGASFAQTSPTIPFPEYMEQPNKSAVQPPYGATDRLPVIRNGVTGYVPGDKIVTPDSPQTVTGKTFDYNSNTFLNFPVGGGTGGVLPTSCSGLPDGSLYNSNGTVAICTTGNNGTTSLTWDDASQVTFDDGTPVAGF